LPDSVQWRNFPRHFQILPFGMFTRTIPFRECLAGG
jgi:hypothetical protein